MCVNAEFSLPHLLLMKLWSLFLRGGTTSQQLCRHGDIFVPGSARAGIERLEAFGPDDVIIMTGELRVGGDWILMTRLVILVNTVNLR